MVDTKVCKICKIEKSLSDFKKDRKYYRSYCRECDKYLNRTKYYNKEKVKEIYWKNREKCLKNNNEYRRTKGGLITFIYNKIKYRVRKQYTGVNLTFTKEEFRDFALKSKIYDDLFNNWVINNFTQAYVPTVDRIDNNKHYSLDNIQFLSQRENSSKKNNKEINSILSKYVGVCWDRDYKKFRAAFQYKNKKTHIGRFENELEAAIAVNNKCIELGIPIKNIGV